MKINKSIALALTLVAFCAFSSFEASGQSANELLKKTITALRKSESWTATYVMNAEGEKNVGTLTAQSSYFKIDSPRLKVWFDGKTQWTYLVDDGEVDITTPTKAELQQINPFAVIDNCMKNYTASMARGTINGKTSIELTSKDPKTNGGITKVILSVNPTTYLPESLSITMSSKNVIYISISSLTGGKALGAAHFRPLTSQFNGAEIVDLR